MRRDINANWLGTCRGLAVVGVFLTHFLPRLDEAFQLNSALIRAITIDVIDTGKFGVALLFLIAGYLTFTSKKKRTVKQFAVNRFFRLYPLYWLTIALVGLLFHFDNYGTDTVLANITMLQVFFRKPDLVGLFWTLPIELMLYVGAVVLERYVWDYKKLFPLVVIGAAGTVGIAVVRRTVWPLAPVAVGLLLTIGLLGQIFRLYRNGDVTGKQLLTAVLVFEGCLMASSLLAYQADTGFQENWHRYFLSYSLAIAVFSFFIKTEKKVTVLTLLAVIAYPVYLLQEIVLRLAFDSVWQPGMNRPAFVVVTLAALLLVSLAAHLAVEKPMGKIGDRIENRIGQKEKPTER